MQILYDQIFCNYDQIFWKISRFLNKIARFDALTTPQDSLCRIYTPQELAKNICPVYMACLMNSVEVNKRKEENKHKHVFLGFHHQFLISKNNRFSEP